MKVADIDIALAYFENGVVELRPAATQTMLENAENRLDIALPSSLREFLTHRNGGWVGRYPLLGVPPIDKDLDLVEDNERVRRVRAPYWNPAHLVVAPDQSGDYYVAVLDQRDKNGDCPVAFVDGISLEIEWWAGSNYLTFLWFYIGSLKHDYQPDGTPFGGDTEEPLPDYPWPFDHEWVLQHDPELKMWLGQSS
ncbi:MAG: SMI1/KNR4 family protein [Chloroflexota bacterium]|nr:MAG: SMI1/KNR4 family protein [Chloroflexota bacterium]